MQSITRPDYFFFILVPLSVVCLLIGGCDLLNSLLRCEYHRDELVLLTIGEEFEQIILCLLLVGVLDEFIEVLQNN